MLCIFSFIVLNSSSFVVDSDPSQFILCYKDEITYPTGAIVIMLVWIIFLGLLVCFVYLSCVFVFV